MKTTVVKKHYAAPTTAVISLEYMNPVMDICYYSTYAAKGRQLSNGRAVGCDDEDDF